MNNVLPQLLGFEPHTFAAFTLRERLPRIVEDVSRGLALDPPATARLALLRSSLPDGMPPAAIGQASRDREFWDGYASISKGLLWRELPFMQAEFIFYRALLDAVDYEAQSGLDPFLPVKTLALEQVVTGCEPAAQQTDQLRSWSYGQFQCAVDWALQGNRADGSQLSSPGSDQQQCSPLCNDLRQCFDQLSPELHGFIDIALDNVGEELLGDLVLIDYLLKVLPGIVIRAHLKPEPIFVSDVTLPDWRAMLRALATNPRPDVAAWGERLVVHERSGRLLLCSDPFWCRPLNLAEVDTPLRQQLIGSSLLILKGDLNYRRYVEDRAWPADSPTAQHRIQAFAPALALRVLKSELIVGINLAAIARLTAEEPDWLFSGKHRIIQFFP